MYPNEKGYYGRYGGRFVPETLIPALDKIEQAYKQLAVDPEFQAELDYYLKNYVGRESPLYLCERLSRELGARIYLKREDLNHTGSHKINNTLGQALLAKRMGKERLIAETGAGQHGVATATAAAVLGMKCTVYMGARDMQRQRLNVFRMQMLGAEIKERLIAETGAGQHGVATATAAAVLGMKCTVYMGARDMQRQRLNVFRMRMLGAEVKEVNKGSETLKDATNEAFRDFIQSFEYSHMLIGSVVGPHPYPMMVRDFQSVIGREVKEQFKNMEDRLPSHILACVGGGSNAMGIFYPFLNETVELIGVEAGGRGISPGEHCATLAQGDDGILHGALSRLLQDENGQILDTHSISAGLDYPGVGPEHAYLRENGRVNYVNVSDEEAINGFLKLSEYEGIIPALESAHAVAYALKMAPELPAGSSLVINLSGRGDKDTEEVSRYLEERQEVL